MRIVFILSFIVISCNSIAQQYNRSVICGTDTVQVDYRSKIDGRISYKGFECSQVSPVGIRVDVGTTWVSYPHKTKQFIGNHRALLLALSVPVKNFNVGVRVKFYTIRPNKSLIIKEDTLTSAAKLNPGKIDFFVAYSVDLPHNFSVEPSLGITKNLFYVINEEEINQTYNIPAIYGMITGLTIN